ncbi:hypothetical protein H6771_01715 [Candidatus Peribacteria bacterium]|nr:hypothetical protein [Candidatus Peribacteria bacterium]
MRRAITQFQNFCTQHIMGNAVQGVVGRNAEVKALQQQHNATYNTQRQQLLRQVQQRQAV